MSMFSRIEGGLVLITNRGVYQEADLYRRGEELFARLKTGFGRLLTGNLTTVPGVRWKAIEGINYREEFDGPKVASTTTSPEAVATPGRKKLRAI